MARRRRPRVPKPQHGNPMLAPALASVQEVAPRESVRGGDHRKEASPRTSRPAHGLPLPAAPAAPHLRPGRRDAAMAAAAVAPHYHRPARAATALKWRRQPHQRRWAPPSALLRTSDIEFAHYYSPSSPIPKRRQACPWARFLPQSPLSHPLGPSLHSKQQPSPWDCSTIPKLQLPATASSRGPASLCRVCMAVARTV